jgi:hypothetical protein
MEKLTTDENGCKILGGKCWLRGATIFSLIEFQCNIFSLRVCLPLQNDFVPCRGSDMKLRPDAKALLTLGPGMCRDKLMQAAMRMRQLEQNQSLMLVASSEVSRSVSVKTKART